MSLPIKFDHFSDKQKVILLVCIAIIFLGIGVGLVTVKKTPPPPPVKRIPPPAGRPTATPTPAPAFFNLMPSNKILKVGETLTLSLTLNSRVLPIDAVDIILTYDPTIFKAEKVVAGKIFAQYPIKQFDNKEGKVQLSAAAEIKNGQLTSFSGQGEYGSITFRALKATDSAQIMFDSNSVAASAGKDRLDLEKSLGGKYTVTK